MSVEILTYSALGARLNISPVAARSLARRLGLPRSRAEDGKALVSVDLAEIKHRPHPSARREACDVAQWTTMVAALHVEIAQLEASVAGHRADFEHERERADRRGARHRRDGASRCGGPAHERRSQEVECRSGDEEEILFADHRHQAA